MYFEQMNSATEVHTNENSNYILHIQVHSSFLSFYGLHSVLLIPKSFTNTDDKLFRVTVSMILMELL
jgi:hypothetical protein